MRTINVSEETFEKIKDQLVESEKYEINDYSDFVGKSIFIRTVTYHWVGKVEKIVSGLIELSDASWVADSGRFMQAIKDGTLSEVEPVGTAFINRETIVDVIPWVHELPTEQK